MNPQKVKIYGERCSGTNYLEQLLLKNFNVQMIPHEYGHKHFFGFHNLNDSDNVLFICVVRDPVTWINSFYKNPWHVHPNMTTSTLSFLSQPFQSVIDKSYQKSFPSNANIGDINKEDVDMYTKKPYKNIMELRHVKLKWMIETLPTMVKNYCLIRYEDLVDHFEETMDILKETGLSLKNKDTFPENHNLYKKQTSEVYVSKTYNEITKKDLLHHKSFNDYYEIQLSYL